MRTPGVHFDAHGRPSRADTAAYFHAQAFQLPARASASKPPARPAVQRPVAALGDVFTDLVNTGKGAAGNVTDIASLQREILRLSTEADRWKAEAQALAKRAGAILGVSNPAELVEWITIETEYTPLIRLDEPFKHRGPTNKPSIPRRVGQILKPRFTIKFKELSPVVAIPFAAPGPTKWPLVATLAGAAVGGFAGGLFFGFKGLLIGGAVAGGLARSRVA